MAISDIDRILDVPTSLKETEQDLKIIRPALNSLIDFSIKTAKFCFVDAKNFNLPLIIILLHSIELVDAIDILVKQSSIYPCYLLVRSLFETKIYIEYMLQIKTKERSLAYEYFAWQDNIKRWEPYVKPTPELLMKMSQDKSLKGEKFPPENVNHIQGQIKWYQTNMEDQRMAIVVEEIAKIEDQFPKQKNNLKWYSLFPLDQTVPICDFKTLCEKLGYPGYYLLSYKYLSQYAHSQEVTRFIRGIVDKSNLPLLRRNDEIWHVAILTSQFQTKIVDLFCEFEKQTEQYSEWYKDFEPKLNAMKNAFMEQFTPLASNGNPS